MWLSILVLSPLVLMLGGLVFRAMIVRHEPVSLSMDAENSVCFNEELILRIQRDQWMKAKREVLGSEQAGAQGSDMAFYKQAYGAVDVSLMRQVSTLPVRSAGSAARKPSSPKTKTSPRSKPLSEQENSLKSSGQGSPYASLVYYRIFKNSNDYIRSLLTEFVYVDSDQEREFKAQVCFKPSSECISSRLHQFTPGAMESQFVRDKSKRFAFTFVRDPLSRFISAMTEVEYRASLLPNDATALPLRHARGSSMRVQEFIRMLLLSGGAFSLFRDFAAVEIVHIAPTIATLVLAHKVEGRPLRTYPIESFNDSWSRMSGDVGVPLLDTLQRRRQPAQMLLHPSSSDPLNTTLAAKSFLSYASDDAYQRFGASLSTPRLGIAEGFTSPTEYQQHSRIYLRALCRIYLIDYMCLNYTLPTDCQDLPTEMLEIVDEYSAFESHRHATHQFESVSDLLRIFLPSRWLRRLSFVSCWNAPSPECEARFVHGHHVVEASMNHDEL